MILSIIFSRAYRVRGPVSSVILNKLYKSAGAYVQILCGVIMSESVYKVIELVGSSETSWEDAVKKAVESASKSIRDLRVCEVVKLDTKIEDNMIVAYRARVQLSFKYEME